MPSVTFSLRPHHLDAIREAAHRRHVSQSEVVRQILDLAFREAPSRDQGGAPGRKPRAYAPPSMAPLIKEVAAIRRELARLRDAIARLEATQLSAVNRLARAASEANGSEPPTRADA